MEGFLQHKVEQNQSLWEDAKINATLNDPNLDLQKLKCYILKIQILILAFESLTSKP
jgi:hypothetical protein